MLCHNNILLDYYNRMKSYSTNLTLHYSNICIIHVSNVLSTPNDTHPCDVMMTHIDICVYFRFEYMYDLGRGVQTIYCLKCNDISYPRNFPDMIVIAFDQQCPSKGTDMEINMSTMNHMYRRPQSGHILCSEPCPKIAIWENTIQHVTKDSLLLK